MRLGPVRALVDLDLATITLLRLECRPLRFNLVLVAKLVQDFPISFVRLLCRLGEGLLRRYLLGAFEAILHE